MTESNIVKVGTDTSGRPIFMSRYMQRWWKRIVKLLGFEPTIVQGAYMVMAGGGAKDSAGYHDGGGCLDLRVWDLTPDQIRRLNRVVRSNGAAGWLRDKRHGMDPHYHLVLGSDESLSAGAQGQWNDYLNGLNGLADKRSDYEWRPDPLVRVPVFPDKAPINAGIKAAIAGAKALGYDGIVTRLKRVRSDVGSK